MKKLILLTTLFVVYSSCKNDDIIAEKDFKVIKNCISKISSNNPFIDSCFVVKPYFTLDSLYKSGKQVEENLLSDAGLGEKLFDKVQKRENKVRQTLLALSQCEKSEFVLSISEIVNNHVLVLLEYKYSQININQIIESDNFKNNAWDLHLFNVVSADSIVEVDQAYMQIR